MGMLYNDMRQSLRNAETQIPQLKGVRDKYADLINAEDRVKEALRTHKTLDGENVNIAVKIRRFNDDVVHYPFKQNITEASDILKKYPETAPLADFDSKVKAAQLSISAKKAEGGAATGLGKEMSGQTLWSSGKNVLKAVTKVASPKFKINTFANWIDKGYIKPEEVSKIIKTSKNPIFGTAATTTRALSGILSPSKIALNASLSKPSMAIRSYLSQQEGEK
jgi:hypothetical protein